MRPLLPLKPLALKRVYYSEVIAASKEIALPNVLFVARRVQQIADLMKVRPATAD